MDELEIFAKTLYGEARGETLAGIEAVANVILNRHKMALHQKRVWWGKSIPEICLKPWQFSCWNPADPNFKLLQQDLSQEKSYQICKRVALRALHGNLRDNTHGATHYHSLSITPYWARGIIPSAQIGAHLFYTLN
ncbi:MAG: cell wall hydrolase [Alphaproteobacteria bacterium]